MHFNILCITIWILKDLQYIRIYDFSPIHTCWLVVNSIWLKVLSAVLHVYYNLHLHLQLQLVIWQMLFSKTTYKVLHKDPCWRWATARN